MAGGDAAREALARLCDGVRACIGWQRMHAMQTYASNCLIYVVYQREKFLAEQIQRHCVHEFSIQIPCTRSPAPRAPYIAGRRLPGLPVRAAFVLLLSFVPFTKLRPMQCRTTAAKRALNKRKSSQLTRTTPATAAAAEERNATQINAK